MRRLFVLMLFVAALALPVVAYADSPTHQVQAGETLYSIARQYGISPQALASANGMTTQSWVYVGQRLVIPSSSGSTATSDDAAVSVAQASPSGIYLVRAGDTLFSVSRKFGVSVGAIADANDIPPNGFLYSGTELKIPGVGTQPKASNSAPQNNSNPAPANASTQNNAGTSKTTTTYIVRAGDTLYGIAIQHNVTMAAIRVANNLPTPFVYTGQRLVIPNTFSSSTVESTPANNIPAPPAASAGISIKVENIPSYVQQQTLTCEEAAASMAVRGALSEAQIVAAMPRSDNPFDGIRGTTNFDLIGGLTHYGTYAQGLQKGLAKLGHQSTAYYGRTYVEFKASILENLKQGRPVVWWTTWHESYERPQVVQVSNGAQVSLTPYEHTVLIVAANDDGVTYHDPYDGSTRFTSWANHQRTSGYFNNMALVVY